VLVDERPGSIGEDDRRIVEVGDLLLQLIRRPPVVAVEDGQQWRVRQVHGGPIRRGQGL